MPSTKNWTAIAESNFPWEREALEFVRAQFPHEESYRAWSNFEFIADDGSINEVDLLVFTPQGFFLIFQYSVLLADLRQIGTCSIPESSRF